MKGLLRRIGIALLACVAVALCAHAAEYLRVNQQYVIYGDEAAPIDSVFRADGSVRDSIIYRHVSGTIDTTDMPDTLAAAGTRTDTLLIRAIDSPTFRVCVQYKTRGRETGTDTALVVKIRPLDAGHTASHHDRIFDEEYYINPDSTRDGWWGGCLVLRRDAFWRKAEVVTTNNDATAVDSLFLIFDSLPVARSW